MSQFTEEQILALIDLANHKIADDERKAAECALFNAFFAWMDKAAVKLGNDAAKRGEWLISRKLRRVLFSFGVSISNRNVDAAPKPNGDFILNGLPCRVNGTIPDKEGHLFIDGELFGIVEAPAISLDWHERLVRTPSLVA